MLDAMNAIITTSLDERRKLLALGFADHHPLCKWLDTWATDADNQFIAQRRAYIAWLQSEREVSP
jgi:hypothetical protein